MDTWQVCTYLLFFVFIFSVSPSLRTSTNDIGCKARFLFLLFFVCVCFWEWERERTKRNAFFVVAYFSARIFVCWWKNVILIGIEQFKGMCTIHLGGFGGGGGMVFLDVTPAAAVNVVNVNVVNVNVAQCKRSQMSM